MLNGLNLFVSLFYCYSTTGERESCVCEVIPKKARFCCRNFGLSNSDAIHSQNEKLVDTKVQFNKKDLIYSVAKTVEIIGKKASIPTVSHQRICQCIQRFYDRYDYLNRVDKKQRCGKAYIESLNIFKKDGDRIMDIACCKCTFFKNCICPREKKVQPLEHKFLNDQRTSRKMKIGEVDLFTTKKINRKLNRKELERQRLLKISKTNNKTDSQLNTSNESTLRDDDQRFPNIEQTTQNKNKKKQYNMQHLPNLSLALDRYGISDRAGSFIATSVLQDYGVITKTNTVNVIDKNKVRNARKNKRKELQSNNSVNEVNGLYFDGRKDRTLTMIDNCRKTIIEEHIVLISEPNSKYFDHITPKSGSAGKCK